MSRRHRAAACALVVALAACGPPAEDAASRSAPSAGAAPANDGSPAGRLFARADAVDSLAVAHPEREAAYALVGGRLLPVPAGAEWPDSADAEVRLFTDTAGRVLRHVEVPASPSREWTLALFHYFDDSGRTTVFRSVGSYFRAGCPTGVVRDRRRTAYAGSFQPLVAERRLEDNQGRPVQERDCGHPHAQFGGNPQPDVAALRRLGLAPPPAGR